MNESLPIVSSLSASRTFTIFVADIGPEDVAKNSPYVLRIPLPERAQFLQLLQIRLPLPSNPVLTAFAYLFDPDAEKTHITYITPVFNGQVFPWHVAVTKKTIRDYLGGRCGDELVPAPLVCRPLGISEHGLIHLLHVETVLEDPTPEKYAAFEAELVKIGYMIVPVRPHVIPKEILEGGQAVTSKPA
jgi:hypothetical protein